MAGRRLLSLAALGAALFLSAPSGAAWASPHAQARHSTHGHGEHREHCGHGKHGAHGKHGGRWASCSTDPDGSNDAALSPNYRSADDSDANSPDAAGVRDVRKIRGKAHGHHKHNALHGRANGHVKHGGHHPTNPGGQHAHVNHPPGAVTVVDERPVSGSSSGAGRPHPVPNPPAQHQSPGPRTDDPDPVRPDRPADQPVAQVLRHSKVLRFATLPIAIVGLLALGVCGLIGLARYRTT